MPSDPDKIRGGSPGNFRGRSPGGISTLRWNRNRAIIRYRASREASVLLTARRGIRRLIDWMRATLMAPPRVPWMCTVYDPCGPCSTIAHRPPFAENPLPSMESEPSVEAAPIVEPPTAP